ncbi:TetR/AcrR family transcriptional regulator C-terminal ligand-binding domain-containing protein [Microbacterium sp.]|uniref:TetR/AcrR family transcriptional regulator n=1 Tax=Microbacterium sp. TaxID=51671 RepID=UPI00333E9E0F
MDTTDTATPSEGMPGRPRAAAIDDALRSAFEELIAEIPLREFSVRALVARAGTTRDAFYRRYGSLGHFFIEVMLSRYATDPTEDTGSLVGDLLVIQREQRDMYNDPIAKGLLPLILDASFRDPVTADALSEQFITPQRAAVVALLTRAVDRGEVSAIADVDYVIDQLYAPMLFRSVLPGRGSVDEEYGLATIRTALRELGHPDPEGAVAQGVSAERRARGGRHGEA